VTSGTFQAETLALPASLLTSLPNSWSPSFPLVVFTGTRYGFIGEEERETIWRKYAMPVFEQLLDEKGRVLAVECEAHNGLHIEPELAHAISSGELIIDGSPISVLAEGRPGLCGCGRPDARISVGPLPAGVPVQLEMENALPR
jgi:hypothetical protein